MTNWDIITGTSTTYSFQRGLFLWRKRAVSSNNVVIYTSVTDLGCLTRIPDLNFFYPGSRVKKAPDPASRRICNKEFKYFNQGCGSGLDPDSIGSVDPDPDP
jgi:hypothetical protein